MRPKSGHCRKCGALLTPANTAPDGYSPCVPCRRLSSLRDYHRNKQARQAAKRAWRKAHPEQHRWQQRRTEARAKLKRFEAILRGTTQ